MRNAGFVLASTVLLMLLASCEHADPLTPDGGEGPPTLETVQAAVFDTNCAVSGCHIEGTAAFGLNLSAGQARDNLVNVPSAEVPDLLRVDPGNPDDSYLVIKIEGGSRMATGTGRMPLGRPSLSAEQMKLVRDWIAGGAE